MGKSRTTPESGADGQVVSEARMLRRQMLALRADEPHAGSGEFWVHRETVAGRSSVQVWFQTRGCTWHRRGECTMCNYGVGPDATADVMVARVAAALDDVEESDELWVSPSGSLLDEREVPDAALDGILALLASAPAATIAFETRPETVTADRLAKVAFVLAHKQVTVSIGLESSNADVRQRSYAKSGSDALYAQAFLALTDIGFATHANLSFGAPFLSAAARHADTVRSARWARSHGATPVVFPLHVKRNTLLEMLWRQGAYEPPTFGAIVGVLRACRPQRPGVAWIEPPPAGDFVLASPSGCAACHDERLTALRSVRSTADVGELDALTTCGCDSADVNLDSPLLDDVAVASQLDAALARWGALTVPEPSIDGVRSFSASQQ